MNDIFLETQRLVLRRMTPEDFEDLCRMLQDIEVMYAWEYAFTEDQVRQWIDKRIAQYGQWGYSYFLVIDKATGRAVGQIGILNEAIEGKTYLGIGWILARDQWGKGYATEGAKACVEYAFGELHADQVIADIRPENTASRDVAERIDMAVIGEYIKDVNGKAMPHLIYSISREHYFAATGNGVHPEAAVE